MVKIGKLENGIKPRYLWLFNKAYGTLVQASPKVR